MFTTQNFSIQEYAFMLFIAISTIHILYILIQWIFIFTKESKSKQASNPVSVLVCAKNEEKNIPEFLKSIQKQTYHNYELILINDNSFDKTLNIFEAYAEKNSNVSIVDVKENSTSWRGKKFALTLGIKKAKNEILLFTDADCKPISPNWIETMASGYKKDTEIVLGYGPYKRLKGLLNMLIRYETTTTASNYFSYAKIFTPYMGVGRNLSYKKSLFFNKNGFYSHMNVASGDDDLFVNENATKKNTEIVFSEDTSTISEPETKWSSWIKQKKRHLSASSSYSKTTKLLLGLQSVTHVLFYITFFILLALNIQTESILIIFAVRTLIFLITFSVSAKKLKTGDLSIWSPFLDIILLILLIIIKLSPTIRPQKHWA